MKELWYSLDEYTRMAIGLAGYIIFTMIICYTLGKLEMIFKSSEESLRSKTKQPRKRAVRTI